MTNGGKSGADRDVDQGPRGLIRLLLAYAIVAIFEMAVWTTVTLYAYSRGGAGSAGVAMSLTILPAIVLSPVLASIGDRIPRNRALASGYATTAIVLGGMTALLLAQAPVLAVVAGSALVSICMSVTRPIHYASLPSVASSPETLVRANSATLFSNGVAGFIGPWAAGMCAQTIGAGWLTAVGIVGLLVCVVLVWGLRLGDSAVDVSGAEAPPTVSRESDGGLLAGFKQLLRDRPVLVILLLSGVGYVITGSQEILSVAFGSQVLGVGQSQQGLLVGAPAIGALAGAVIGGALAYRARLAPLLFVGLLVAGFFLLCMGGVRSFVPAFILVILAGFGDSFAGLASETLVQRTVADSMLARVFAIWESIMLLGYLVGAVVAPALVAIFGPNWAYAPLGALLVLAALATRPTIRALDARADFRADVLSLLQGLRLFTSMRPADVDRLSQTASWQDFDSNERVIVQGEGGDAFYVVQSGRLSVEVDGVRRSADLVTGEGFGEIALLRDVPRTATVTTLEPTRLLRIERDDFLAAVTRHVDGHRIAMEIADAHRGPNATGR